MGPNESNEIEYGRRLYADILKWYERADLKGQLLLTTNGAFLTVLAGLILTRRADLVEITRVFGPETWLFLGGMAASLLATFVAAVRVLYSRIYTGEELARVLEENEVNVDDAGTYSTQVLWFFQFVSCLRPDELAKRLTMDARTEAAVLASQAVLLGRNVVEKHRWVNRGFILSGVTLSCLLLATTSYLIRLTVIAVP